MGMTWEEFKRDPGDQPKPVVTNELLARMILAQARLIRGVGYKSAEIRRGAERELAELAKEAGLVW